MYVVTEALENVKKGVFSGDTLTKLFLKEPLFPPTFSQLISVGEQTGQLDEMFGSVASYYEEEFDNTVDNMSSYDRTDHDCFYGNYDWWTNDSNVFTNI